MIDFRYHIVSLIAVFLALAVGVVLGAGPLRGSLGEQLTGQIETLRQEKENLRIDLEAEQALTEDLTEFIDAAAGPLLADTLTDVDVAVVQLPGADAADTEAVLERIAEAGGDVVGRLEVAERWTDPEQATARDAAAAEVSGQMLIPPADGTPAAQVLGQALAVALTERDPLSTDAFTLSAQAIYSSLLGHELVSELEAPTVPADVVLLLAPATLTNPDDADAEVLALEVETVRGFTGRTAVLAGSDAVATDLVDAVRADAEASEAVSTVDSFENEAGQVIVPLALAASAYGAGVAHYGLTDGATAVLPTIPQPEDPTGETADDTTDDATADPTGDEQAGDAADDATEDATEEATS